MFRWGTEFAQSSFEADVNRPGLAGRTPVWARVIPFFLSALFFGSVVFSVFSPLPLLFLHLRSGRKWAWFALLTNGALVLLTLGYPALIGYLFTAALGLCIPEFLNRRFTIERSAVLTLSAMASSLILIFLIYRLAFHVDLIQELARLSSESFDQMNRLAPSVSNGASPEEIAEMKRKTLVLLPSGFAVMALSLVWANLVILIKASPIALKERLGIESVLVKRWKAPEFLVWPTIVSGFFLVVNVPVVSDIALNVFVFLMAIYGIQGLSILGFLFDIWGVKGALRMIGYSISVFLMHPLVLSLGFFDLWFDFRSKFRQS
ncbi:MAG: DUF2232 domain-containing protein [Bdellovibrio sp.]|nr:DUF2232 domain-containing protein [Bdellovibrio sp.]